MNSQTWKNAEKQWATTLKKYKIPATRISRAANFAVSDFDVFILGHPEYKSDSKYRKSGFSVSKLLDDIRKKYCKSKADVPILVTKSGGQHGENCMVEDEFLAMILSFWLGFGTKEELQGIYDVRNR
jgi:hypothetical protein